MELYNLSVHSTKLILDNGLEVILHQDRALPVVGVNIWYHVGSKDEQVGRTGFAHLFEHLMFEGSKHHNRDYFEPFQRIGGVVNGSTTSDRTNYWETVPSEHLELALWLESDRMGFLLDALDQKRFDIQRDVVKNERRQSYENRPYGKAQLLLQSAVFPTPHPYNWPVIGSQEDLDAASLEDVRGFFRKYYCPSNASLAIAGDFDTQNAVRLVEHYFGDIGSRSDINRVERMDSGLGGQVDMAVRDRVQLPRLYLVWPSCPMFDPYEAPLDVLATVLGDGKSSRLYRELVYERQIARHVMVANYSQEIAGEFHIEVTANPGCEIGEIEEVIGQELTRIWSEPISDRELNRAKNRIESDHVFSLEKLGGFGGRADQLNHYNVFAGDPSAINTDIVRYNAVAGEDVMHVAESFLRDYRVRLEVKPQLDIKASRASINRVDVPKSALPDTYIPPSPYREKLSNGLNILGVEKTDLPTVSFGIVLHAGASKDPLGRPGLGSMVAASLIEGTNSRSSQMICDEMEFMGSDLNSQVYREHMLLSAEALTPHWSKALEVMADVIKNAAFPDREIERVRKEQLADLKRGYDDSGVIAERVSRALIYGPDSSYGHPGIGTEASIEAISRNELIDYFRSRYDPSNATLVVVGDVTKEEVVYKVKEALGDWSSLCRAGDIGEGILEPERSTSTTIYLAHKPGAPQSVIRAGHAAVPRSHSDYNAMTLVNYAFGGQPTARLFMNLRQDKGYSYGYYSTIDWFTETSTVFAGGAVETSVTKESVNETLKEFVGISGGMPITEKEYEAAMGGLIRSFPLQFEAQGHILQQLVGLVVLGLPDDHWSVAMSDLSAVSLAEVHRVAADRIDNQRLMVLVVGDREVVGSGLAELGLPIVSVDYDGRLVH